VEKLYLNYEQSIFGSVLDGTPELKVEHLRLKIDFLRRPNRHKMVNICLRELLKTFTEHFIEDEMMEKEVKGVWQSSLVDLISSKTISL
jgi:hypothetical protein